MTGRELLVLAALTNCVLSLPVTSSQLENEDVKVMKCIVEALADVLSRSQSVSVSQECLVTLKTDDRLVTVLRHHNFLKELQDIAVQGNQERAQLRRDTGAPDPTTQTPETVDASADRSMLEALGGPGERSILSQKRTGNVAEENKKDEALRGGESQEDNDGAEEVKRENDEHPGNQASESVDEWSEGRAKKREEEEEEDSEEKRANSEEDNLTNDRNGAGSDAKGNASGNEPKQKKFHEDDEKETGKRSALSSHKQMEGEEEDEEEKRKMKRGSRKSLKQWTKRGESMELKKKSGGKAAEEVSHHSKEATDEEQEEEEKEKGSQRSPEEKELQMIARRAPEERRVTEEEGSASRKSEEPEIESLAAIESELENAAQKLHELRRG